MKIAFIVGSFPVLSETFILNQITGLISRGHKIDIYGYKPDDISKVHPDIEKYHLLEHTFYQPGIPENYLWRLIKGLGLIFRHFHKAPLVLLRSLNIFQYGKRAASMRLLYAIIPLLNTEAYDIIHCQFGIYGIDGMIYRDIGAIKGKLITSFRGYDISWYLKECGKDVYNELFVKGDFFLANCEFFRQRAIQLGCDENKIVVHGSGIDCSKFTFKPRYPHPDGKIRIATTGRLVEKKGIEYSIRAIANLANIHPNIEYNIIGDGHLKEHLQQVIEELNLADGVKLVGWKNQKELIEILDQTHLFIAPSVTAEDGNQDAPVNTLKEAMAMGLPVIGTIHGGIPELVEDGISGFLVPERDAEAISEKLSYFIKHPEIWEQMGSSGRDYVEKHYDINKLNDELVETYRQVATKNSQERQKIYTSVHI
ncbi:glycosyltransferase [Scytonema hofmannii FACHB-248]|uniref:Glycosyltransferase n=1 Tax=Scytonema hofmannii FACHB-248 TaxID=1842502 RepID=A0ABR8GIY9_9CYAN|nr:MULTISPECIES: glycosyltransferase [Nostocales]MBD2603201.1 glycosyltransferase [Scytonema hofmannii FACHB-248]